MSSESTLLPLENCLDALIDYREKTPDKTCSGVPLITAKIIKGGRIEKPTEFIATDNYDSWMRRGIPKAGDVVLTVEAPLGEVAQLGPEKIALAQRVVTLRGKVGLLDNTYLLYLLQTEEMQSQLKARATGTTVLGIKQSELRKVALNLPPIKMQVSAATTLKALDDRITLLRETNATLEAIAQALFKSWFVDFDPIHAKQQGRAPEGMDEATAALFPDSFEESELGLVPKGWRVLGINQTCELGRGSSPRPIQQFLGGNVPWIKIADATASDGLFVFETKEMIIQDGVKNSVKVQPGDLIMSNSASCGITVFVELHGCIHDGWLYFKNYQQTSKNFLFFWLRKIADHLVHIADGSVQKNLNIALVSSQKIICPSPEVLGAFDWLVGPLLERVRENCVQTQTLATLRDTLLPRLISGQLRLPEAEAMIEHV